MKYEVIYYYFNEAEDLHEWKLNYNGEIGFLNLDDLEVRGQHRINDNFFNKYSDYIEWKTT